jgi:hypothetical protein
MALCALATVNILPVVWMIASYVVLGDWLPALHVTNAWMVSFADAPKAMAGAGFDLPTNQSPYMPQINMLVLALGSFPLEIGLSLCGLILFLKSNWSRPVCTYLLMVVSVLLLFGAVFKWRLPASLVFARYFVPFVALLIPFAGYLLFRLFSTSGFHQRYAIIALVLIVSVTVSVDLGRAFNYPDVFPKDAIAAGWMLRRLQENGVIPETSKILIERTKDFGDLGIVALANRPERFVAINQSVYEQSAVDSLTAGRPNRSSAIISARDGVRGRACDAGFNMEPCKNSFVREEFNLVILSTPRRIVSFEETFARRAWVIGRYHIFDMSSLRVQMRTKILA